MHGRHSAPDVFAARLGRIDILQGGFARLVFHNLDDSPIDPAIVMPLPAILEAVRKQVDATEWARELAVERLLHETH